MSVGKVKIPLQSEYDEQIGVEFIREVEKARERIGKDKTLHIRAQHRSDQDRKETVHQNGTEDRGGYMLCGPVRAVAGSAGMVR